LPFSPPFRVVFVKDGRKEKDLISVSQSLLPIFVPFHFASGLTVDILALTLIYSFETTAVVCLMLVSIYILSFSARIITLHVVHYFNNSKNDY
jgi:hypothetical protein